ELPRVADAKFESRWLAAREAPHFANEPHQLDWCCERGVASWRNAIPTARHAADMRDLARDLRGRQHATMPWLGTLAQLQLDHFDLRNGCNFGKPVGCETAIAIATTKIA